MSKGSTQVPTQTIKDITGIVASTGVTIRNYQFHKVGNLYFLAVSFDLTTAMSPYSKLMTLGSVNCLTRQYQMAHNVSGVLKQCYVEEFNTNGVFANEAFPVGTNYCVSFTFEGVGG